MKIIAPETANLPSCQTYVDTLLADSTAASYVSLIATHPYSSGKSANLGYHAPQDHGKSFWETEWSQENSKGDTPDPGMTSAIDMAKHIHDHMVTTGMNAWSWWAIYIAADALRQHPVNPALIQPDATDGAPYMFKRGYALGNWSKFVRPGFQRIGATERPTGDVLDRGLPRRLPPSDHRHQHRLQRTVTQKIPPRRGLDRARLTPWVTSPGRRPRRGQELDRRHRGIHLRSAGESVVTFVNWDATTETPGLGRRRAAWTGHRDAGAIPPTGSTVRTPVVPSNGAQGGVTDFTDWNVTDRHWGTNHGRYGAIYAYPRPRERLNDERRRGHVRRACTSPGRSRRADYRRRRARLPRPARPSCRSPRSSSLCPGRRRDATSSCKSRPSTRRPPAEAAGRLRPGRGELLQFPGREADRGADHGVMTVITPLSRFHELVGDERGRSRRHPVAVHRHDRRPRRRRGLSDRRIDHRHQVPAVAWAVAIVELPSGGSAPRSPRDRTTPLSLIGLRR